MNHKQINALLIDSDVETAGRLWEGLVCQNIILFFTNSIEAAFRLLTFEKYDAILFNPVPFEVNTLETINTLLLEAKDTAIIIFSCLENEDLELPAIRAGVQDYLIKGAVSVKSLGRSIRQGIERHNQIRTLQSMSFTDELTGLYNRRGFFTAAENYINLAKRSNKSLQFVLADLDGLKKINDKYGHQEGDQAIIKTAEILKNTFRESDIIARLGGDEFVMVALEEKENIGDTLITRLQESMQNYNAKEERSYLLSISVGTSRFEPMNERSLDDLIAKADALLYEQKRNKKLHTLASA